MDEHTIHEPDRLKNVGFALDYISSYLRDDHGRQYKTFLRCDQMIASQSDWLILLAKLSHPIDTNFFKEYWAPLEYDSYDWFVDLSEERIPVFETVYLHHSDDKYSWHRLELFDSLTDMMICFEDRDLNGVKSIETRRMEQIRMLDESVERTS
jgi:hypothetical protein